VANASDEFRASLVAASSEHRLKPVLQIAG
jgi:hypothetical protein